VTFIQKVPKLNSRPVYCSQLYGNFVSLSWKLNNPYCHIGELKLLHSSFAVNTLAGIVTLISALLIKVLPDMTKENMPVTSQDIEKVQFPEKITDISVIQVQHQSP
jgi:hypothetical protein